MERLGKGTMSISGIPREVELNFLSMSVWSSLGYGYQNSFRDSTFRKTRNW